MSSGVIGPIRTTENRQAACVLAAGLSEHLGVQVLVVFARERGGRARGRRCRGEWKPGRDTCPGRRSPRLPGAISARIIAVLTASVVVPGPALGRGERDDPSGRIRRPRRDLRLVGLGDLRRAPGALKKRALRPMASSSRWSIGSARTSSAPASRSRTRASTSALRAIARIGGWPAPASSLMRRQIMAIDASSGVSRTTSWCSPQPLQCDARIRNDRYGHARVSSERHDLVGGVAIDG